MRSSVVLVYILFSLSVSSKYWTLSAQMHHVESGGHIYGIQALKQHGAIKLLSRTS